MQLYKIGFLASLVLFLMTSCQKDELAGTGLEQESVFNGHQANQFYFVEIDENVDAENAIDWLLNAAPESVVENTGNGEVKIDINPIVDNEGPKTETATNEFSEWKFQSNGLEACKGENNFSADMYCCVPHILKWYSREVNVLQDGKSVHTEIQWAYVLEPTGGLTKCF